MASLVFAAALPASLARRRGSCEESCQPRNFESEEKWEMEGEAGVSGTEGRDRGLPQACCTPAPWPCQTHLRHDARRWSFASRSLP